MSDIGNQEGRKGQVSVRRLYPLRRATISIVLDMHTDSDLLSKGLARDITKKDPKPKERSLTCR